MLKRSKTSGNVSGSSNAEMAAWAMADTSHGKPAASKSGPGGATGPLLRSSPSLKRFGLKDSGSFRKFGVAKNQIAPLPVTPILPSAVDRSSPLKPKGSFNATNSKSFNSNTVQGDLSRFAGHRLTASGAFNSTDASADQQPAVDDMRHEVLSMKESVFDMQGQIQRLSQMMHMSSANVMQQMPMQSEGDEVAALVVPVTAAIRRDGVTNQSQEGSVLDRKPSKVSFNGGFQVPAGASNLSRQPTPDTQLAVHPILIKGPSGGLPRGLLPDKQQAGRVSLEEERQLRIPTPASADLAGEEESRPASLVRERSEFEESTDGDDDRSQSDENPLGITNYLERRG